MWYLSASQQLATCVRLYLLSIYYPACTCTAGVKQCLCVSLSLSLCVCVCVSAKILKNASSRVAKAYTDVIVNEKHSA